MQPIGYAMNGRDVVVSVGESFEIELSENPTTGYRWQMSATGPSAVELETDKFEPSTEAIGAGGTRRWTFLAVREGNDHLEFEYRRSWERKATELFRIAIQVLAP